MSLSLDLPDTPPDYDGLPDTPPDLDMSALPDTPPDLDLPDAPPDAAPKPAQEPGFMDELKSDVKEAGQFWGDVAEGVGMMFTPSGQQELLSDPKTAGAAGAVIGTSAFFVPGADTPIAETERENRFKAQQQGIDYTPQGPVDPLVAESVGGALGRIGISGPLAPIVEAGGKVAEIAAQEPEEDLTSLKTSGRAALTGGLTYLPMKGGAMAERAIGQLGLGKAATFGANAGADLALGYTSGVGMTAGEKAMTGQEITAADFKPSAMDVVGAGAAGLGGLRGNAARNAEIARANEPVTTPERIAEIEQSLQDEIQGVKSLAHDRLVNRLDREYETDVAAEVDTQARRIGNTQAIDEGPTPEVLALPAPEGKFTAGENPGVLGLSPLTKTKGATDGLQQREVQGETASRPRINQESQEIAATPEPQAGMGVINLAGDQGAPAAPGRPIGGLGLSAIPQAARAPRTEPAADYNPAVGEHQLTGIEDEGAKQALRDLSYQDEMGHQDAGRGTITRQQTLDSATKLARQQGAQMVNTWQKGKAYTGEELKAIESYSQGVYDELSKARQATIADPSQDNKYREKELESQFLKAGRALSGGTREAGRALGALRYVIGGVNTKTPRGADAKLTIDDKAKAIQHVEKQYGDKPVPQSVIDEIEALDPDDVVGLATILEKQTRINNKTGASDAIANFIKAGMLTSPRTFIRNLGGTSANAIMRELDNKVGAVVDWALSKKTGQRSTTAIGLGTTLRNVGSATKEGIREGVAMIKGEYTSEAANEALERFEFHHTQYTGENVLAKTFDLYVNSVFRGTAAADMPARKFAFKQSIVNQAQTTALNEVKSGAITKAEVKDRVNQLVAKPTADMIMEAGLNAEQAAFSTKSKLATKLNSFGRDMANDMEQSGTTIGKIGGIATRVAQATTIPFLKTPINISKDIAKRTMYDLPRGVGKGLKAAFSKKPLTQAEQKLISESIARGGIGTGAVMFGYIAAYNGHDILSGTSEQESTGMKETNKVAGKQAGSLTIGGKNMRIQDVASPLSNLVILGYSIGREAHKYLDPEREYKRPLNVAGAAAKAVTENPFFEGIDRASRAMSDGGFSRYAADTASSVVPNFVADIATLTDDTQRDAYKQPGDSLGDIMTKSIQRKIPGLRNSLPPRVDAFGKVQKEDKANVIDATFSRDARWQKDPFVGELVRLDVGLTKPERKYDEKKREYKETEEQYLARIKQAGDTLEQAGLRIVQQDRYKNADDKTKREILRELVRRGSVNKN